MFNFIKRYYLTKMLYSINCNSYHLCIKFDNIGFGNFFLKKEYEMLEVMLGGIPDRSLYFGNFCSELKYRDMDIKQYQKYCVLLRQSIVRSWIRISDHKWNDQTRLEFVTEQARIDLKSQFEFEQNKLQGETK